MIVPLEQLVSFALSDQSLLSALQVIGDAAWNM